MAHLLTVGFTGRLLLTHGEISKYRNRLRPKSESIVRIVYFHGLGKLSSCRPRVFGGHLQAHMEIRKYRKRLRPKSESFVRIVYLHGLGRLSSCCPQVSGGHLQAPAAIQNMKKDNLSVVLHFMLALPIFTARHQATIVGANELNFCVRDGREPERRRWRSKRGRSVGSGRNFASDQRAGNFAHRNRKQVDPRHNQCIEKRLKPKSESLCWHYLFSRPVTRQLSSA